MKQKKLLGGLLAILIVAGGLFATKIARAASLYTGVQVSDSGSDNTISTGNTTRKVAVAPSGDIYITYHSPTQGVRIAHSTNRGRTFLPSIQLDTVNREAEVAVDQQNGYIYVAWVSGGNVVLSRSTDNGQTYSTAAVVGSAGVNTSAHMAVSNPYVYIILRNSTTFFVNNNNGEGAFTSSTIDTARVFADVHIDPINGYVYIQNDDPNVLYFISTNHGQTFTTAYTPGSDVYYSVSTLSSGSAGKFLYIAGGLDSATIRLNVNTHAKTVLPFTTTTDTYTRTLAADELGNVVSGFTTGGNGKYEVSTDYGVSVATAVTVAATSYISVTLSPVHRDILAVYESGGVIYLSVYQNELTQPTASTPSSSGGGINPLALMLPNLANISFSINNGQPTTTNALVTLQTKAGPDVKSMAISNTADFNGSSIQSLSTSLPWTICTSCQAGQTYTVYLKLYTEYGQSVTLSQNITYNPSNAKTPKVLSANTDNLPSVSFTTDLKVGSKGDDVLKLQQYLNAHGFTIATSGAGSPGNETNLFGNATKKALMKLQAAYKAEILTPNGQTSPNGVFGPSTRAYVNTHP